MLRLVVLLALWQGCSALPTGKDAALRLDQQSDKAEGERAKAIEEQNKKKLEENNMARCGKAVCKPEEATDATADEIAQQNKDALEAKNMEKCGKPYCAP